MKIVIDIPDEAQAEAFLVWALYRGDILLDAHTNYDVPDKEALSKNPRYVFVAGAHKEYWGYK